METGQMGTRSGIRRGRGRCHEFAARADETASANESANKLEKCDFPGFTLRPLRIITRSNNRVNEAGKAHRLLAMVLQRLKHGICPEVIAKATNRKLTVR